MKKLHARIANKRTWALAALLALPGCGQSSIPFDSESSGVTTSYLEATPAWSLSRPGDGFFGGKLRFVGDLNGDGLGDFAVSLWTTEDPPVSVYLGGNPPSTVPNLVIPAGYRFGSAGDVNADGYGDFIVGAPYLYDSANHQFGEADVYYGGPTGILSPGWSMVGVGAELDMGSEASAAGDIDGDGFSDVLVGRSFSVSLFRGGPAGLSTAAAWTYSVPSTAAYQFDSTLRAVAAGDVNADGYGDVVLLEPQAFDFSASRSLARYGSISLFLGSSAGLASVSSSFFFLDAVQSAGFKPFAAGDVNGDGYDDFVVGTYPSINLFLGSPSGLIRSSQVSSPIGFDAVSGAGDVDGDGLDDVVASSRVCLSVSYCGVVQLFRGRPGGIEIVPSWSAWGPTNPAPPDEGIFGAAVCGGDVDGDGLADILVGNPDYAHDVGAISLFHGGVHAREASIFDFGPVTPPTQPLYEETTVDFYLSAAPGLEAIQDFLINVDGDDQRIDARISAPGALFSGSTYRIPVAIRDDPNHFYNEVPENGEVVSPRVSICGDRYEAALASGIAWNAPAAVALCTPLFQQLRLPFAVLNVPPVLDFVSAIRQNESVTVTVNFHDASSRDTFLVTFDWEGTGSGATVVAVGTAGGTTLSGPYPRSASSSHQYQPGSHQLKVHVLDDDGGQSSTATASIVIPAPAGSTLGCDMGGASESSSPLIFLFAAGIPYAIRRRRPRRT